MEALTTTTAAVPQLELGELVNLAAVDTEFYARQFFPQTFRQASPLFAQEMWDALENPDVRLLNLRCFRGSSKTTRLRTFASKRIAYGISRTILYVGASEGDAVRSVNWLRNQMERNHFWRDTFGLRQGNKWQETEIEIFHQSFEHPIWIKAAGMTSSIRGINFDDYRPDLIIVDDPLTDENATTEEQRDKVTNLIFGAIKNSLTPSTEEPNAKMVVAATPQHVHDVTSKALLDDQFRSIVFPCWTRETMFLPVNEQISSWPERFPSEELRKDKIAHQKRNMLSTFAREWECRLTSPETSAFRPGWINVYDHKPEGLFCIYSIDPVPPPSDRELAKGLAGKDFEAHTVWGRKGRDYYLLDYALNNGHEPNWTLAKVFEFQRKYRPAKLVVEAINYQRVLKWIIEQEMKRRGIYLSVVPYVDKRTKFTRIVSTLQGLASSGNLFVGPDHTEFVSQFEGYPDVDHDDFLDASAIALSELVQPYLENQTDPYLLEDVDVEPFGYEGACP